MDGACPETLVCSTSREVPVEKKWAARRKYPRYVVRTRTEGRITGVDEVVLIDISLGGVKIEHAQFFRPGTISPLDLEFHGTRIRLWSRVVWSVVARQEMNMDGEGIMVYHTGLEFHNPSEETRQVINEYLQAMIDEGKATPPDDGVIRRAYTCQKCSESYQLADSEVRPVFMDVRKRPVQAGDLFYYEHDTCDGSLECIFGGPRVPWTVEEEES